LTRWQKCRTIETSLLAMVLATNKGKRETEMQNVSLHRQFTSIAKQAGFMPTYWSCLEISLSNDRTGEPGSLEGWDD